MECIYFTACIALTSGFIHQGMIRDVFHKKSVVFPALPLPIFHTIILIALSF